MDLSSAVLGTSTAKALAERYTAAVLAIGSDRFTRADLAKVRCFNYQAAATLSATIAQLRVKNTRDLFDTISPAELALPRIGSIALAVLGAAFEVKRIGGEAPLEAWVKAHDEDRIVVTFHTIKTRADAARNKRKDKTA